MTTPHPRTYRDGAFVERARRSQIVAATIAVIAEAGYGNASFVRIAERAGISPALISYHFANKAALVEAVVEDVTAAMEAAIADRVPGEATYADMLVAIIQAQIEFFATNAHEVRALASIRAGAHDASTGRSLARDQREEGVSRFEAFFRDGQQSGEFATFDPRLMAVGLVGALEMVPSELEQRPDTDAVHYGREVATTFLRATLSEHRPPRPPPGQGGPR